MSWAETITIIEALKYNFIEVTEDTTVYIPAFVDNILITACGGGGGGGGGTSNYNYISGAGGGGADCINKKPYKVTNRAINITIGKGGTGGASLQKGGNGTPTVIEGYVTLAGGYGGEAGKNTTVSDNISIGGKAGGSGGGKGGNGGRANSNTGKATAGEDGLVGKGGEAGRYFDDTPAGAGGGGGSLGNGGKGAGIEPTDLAENGVLGGGGGGGTATNFGDSLKKGGNGGNGYVRIEWSGLLQ